MIVDETAKIESAVKRIVFGKYINSGQTCVGVDHVYIHEKIYKQFKETLISEVKAAFDNRDNINDGDIGKINNLAHLKKLERLLKENHGGQLLYGGNIVEDKLHISPTVL